MKLRLVRTLLETAAVLLGCPLPVWRRLKSLPLSEARGEAERALPNLTPWMRRGIGDLARFARELK